MTGITSSQQAGFYGPPGISTHAALWSDTAVSYVDLNPSGALSSTISRMSGNQQVGWAHIGGESVAGLWNGTAASFVDLNPRGAGWSGAYDVRGGQQVGVAYLSAGQHAGYWSGSADSWVDLHPVNAEGSLATCTTGTQQGGAFHYPDMGQRAALWSGTAESLIVLHPSGGNKYDATTVYDLTPDYQVGVMDRYGENRIAVMWCGSAESMINMNPSGASSSAIYAACGEYQVGYAVFGKQFHAGLWNKSADSFMDLEPYVSSIFAQGAEADCIWIENGTTYVGGKAYRDGSSYAVMWTIVPEPNVSSFLALILLCTYSRTRARIGAPNERTH